MVTYLEIAALSAYNMFSVYGYLMVNLVVPTSVLECVLGLIAPFLIVASIYRPINHCYGKNIF